MDKYAIWSTMTAKPGQDAEVERFLTEEALPLIREEPGTTRFLVLREKPGAYAIFDTFADEASFQAHLDGPLPKLLAKRAPALFEGEPMILRSDVIAAK
ncbi:MAG: antibiotic biosynthesis monooxygenase [Gemmatimonadaceae bacterium]|nr:antibiotic biosynthesis monooxygenase [Acetobacteraceae bacterium]